MTRLVPALVALVLLATPAAALAQTPQTNAPAGNSAIDEYLETVPGAAGGARPGSGSGGGTGAKGTLTAAQRARLDRLGPDGKALSAIVDATPKATATASKGTAQPATADGRSPLSQVLGAATGSDGGGGGGMGAFLPAILLASLLGAIVLVVVRRRSVS
jgi:hypothetical protein